MKKYRTKIDNPWCKKGVIHWPWKDGKIDCNYALGIDPTVFPEIFEEIPERSDQEKLSEWLLKYFNPHQTCEVIADELAEQIILSGIDVTPITKGME